MRFASRDRKFVSRETQKCSREHKYWCSCETCTRCAVTGKHTPVAMLDYRVLRRPRDWHTTYAALRRSELAATLKAAKAEVQALGLKTYFPALAKLELTNPYLQVRYDTLHACDGGMTMRLLIMMGNHLKLTFNEAKLDLANRRLAAIGRHDDFTHFNKPLWSLDDDKKAARPVKPACNWRCTEYEQLVSQMMYEFHVKHFVFHVICRHVPKCLFHVKHSLFHVKGSPDCFT